MKLVGIAGSNAEISYNRKLMEFIAREYKDLFTLELLDITNLPMFNQDEGNEGAIHHIDNLVNWRKNDKYKKTSRGLGTCWNLRKIKSRR